MKIATTPYEKFAQIAIATLGVLFILSIVFYKERLFFADASFIPYNILQQRSFYIQEHRYGSFITQMVPYLGCKLHLPVQVILKGYTFSFNLFYLIAGIFVYRCRQYALVVVMALYYYLLVSDTYYWTNNEIHQAVAWMFVFFGVTMRMAEQKVKMYFFLPVFLVLAFLAVSTHFLVLIPMVFLWVFLWIRNEGWPWNKNVSILLTVCIGLIVASKFLMIDNHSYDQSRLQNITHPSLKEFFRAMMSPVMRMFAKDCVTNYWLAIIVFIAGITSIVMAKKKALVIWSLISLAGYVVLTAITYSDVKYDVLFSYIESQWQCLGIILAVPFVFYFLTKIKPNYGIVMLSFVFLVRLSYIVAASEKFSVRYELMRSVVVRMKQKGITKLAIADSGTLTKKLMLTWGVPAESTLMSAMAGDMPQGTFCIVDKKDEQLIKQLSDPKTVYESFGRADLEKWNYDYFKPDTTQPYRVMTYEELFKN